MNKVGGERRWPNEYIVCVRSNQNRELKNRLRAFDGLEKFSITQNIVHSIKFCCCVMFYIYKNGMDGWVIGSHTSMLHNVLFLECIFRIFVITLCVLFYFFVLCCYTLTTTITTTTSILYYYAWWSLNSRYTTPHVEYIYISFLSHPILSITLQIKQK